MVVWDPNVGSWVAPAMAAAENVYSNWDYYSNFARAGYNAFREYLRGNPNYQNGPIPQAIRRVANRVRRDVDHNETGMLGWNNQTAVQPYRGAVRAVQAAQRAPHKRPAAAMNLGRSGRINLGQKNLSVGGLQGLQLKFHDVAQEYSGVSNYGGFTPLAGDPVEEHLSPVSLGTGVTDRASNRIFLKSIQFIGSVNCVWDENSISGISATPAVVRCRLYLVLDSQTNGSQVPSNEVWDNGDTHTTAFLRNMSYPDRYKILHSWIVHVPMSYIGYDAVTTKSVGKGSGQFEEYFNLRGILQKYMTDATTGDVADVVDNSLHLFWAPESNDSSPGQRW